MDQLRPTEVVVDASAIRDNVATLGQVAAGAEVCAVVKADGYGHGAVTAARAALEGGATWLAVALVEEGEQLREAGIDAPVMLFSEPPPEAAARLVAARLTPLVYSPTFVAALDMAVARGDGPRPHPVHLHLDTGMTRVGVPRSRWTNVARDLAGTTRLRVEALATHFACADEPDTSTTERQLEVFHEACDVVARAGIDAERRHVANTAATLRFPEAHFDLVRPGIGIYGLSPSVDVDAADHGLRPACSLRSEVAYAKHVEAGTRASYGHRWEAPADGWLATLPVGYADGVPRALSNVGEVLVGGARRQLAGTVTMDQVLVWCGDHRPEAGDEAVLIGTQGGEAVRTEEWAAHADTITYEITCQLTARLPRRSADPSA